MAVLVDVCANVSVTAGRAAKLHVWVSGWHRADFLSSLCRGISDDLIAVEIVKWDLRVRMGVLKADAQICELT